MTDTHDKQRRVERLVEQAQGTVRRIKRVLGYHGSRSTDDFVHGLIMKWLASGELHHLLQRSARNRRLDESVRSAIIDRIRYHSRAKRKGVHVELKEFQLSDDNKLYKVIEHYNLCTWLLHEIARLEAGTVDPRIHVRLSQPAQTGLVLRRCMNGVSQRDIAAELGISLGSVNERYKGGIMYLGLRTHQETSELANDKPQQEVSWDG